MASGTGSSILHDEYSILAPSSVPTLSSRLENGLFVLALIFVLGWPTVFSLAVVYFAVDFLFGSADSYSVAGANGFTTLSLR